jgi:hypothetical protein
MKWHFYMSIWGIDLFTKITNKAKQEEIYRDLIPNIGEDVQKPGKHGESRATAIAL